MGLPAVTTVEQLHGRSLPEPNSGCWLWAGSTVHPLGREVHYGSVRFAKRVQLAHRVMWQLAYGPIPAGQQVMHRCDVPLCVNPSHLMLGTNADNQRDAVQKGRHGRTKKVICLRGHPLSGTNVYVHDGQRYCLACKREWKRERSARLGCRPMATRTHCPAGHPLAGDNLVLYRGHRACRACRQERSRQLAARRKAARALRKKGGL